MAPAVCAAGECPPCLGTAVTYVSGLYTGERDGQWVGAREMAKRVGCCWAEG
jgi:hypothetical protein